MDLCIEIIIGINSVYFYKFDQKGFELKMSRHKRIRIYIECERVFNI